MKEDRQCQNCKSEFRIKPEDFAFYEKMQVPPPTFCPQCRLQRRLMFRNERVFYKRKCDLCGKDMITIHSPDKDRKVYCNPCWWSDKWDSAEFAMDYDPSRSFFEQLQELQKNVPFMALIVEYPSMVNSEYTNHAGHLKDCYFVFNSDRNENCAYLNQSNYSKDCMEGFNVQGCELSYENISIEKCSGVYFSEDIKASTGIFFSKDLSGCGDCFGCVNLRNKHYYIFNKPYSPEEYKKKMAEYNLGSFQSVTKLREEARAFWQTFPVKYMHGSSNNNVSGDYIYNSKNVKEGYIVLNGEDLKFSQWINLPPTKDCYDYTEWGDGAQNIYECITVGQGVNTVKMSSAVWMANSMNVEYSLYVIASSNMFGCVGMRKKQYYILNKQYSKEDFEKIKREIIEQMDEKPYVDTNGRIFRYGEFFPYELSLYDYNETSAFDYFPLDKDAVIKSGWRWKDKENTRYQITKSADELPDDIKDAEDAIAKEIIGCASCGFAFRVVSQELTLLRRFGLPLPRACFECRQKERLRRMNPMKSYMRTCAKCGKEISTNYPPDRPENVYCEQCFNTEVT